MKKDFTNFLLGLMLVLLPGMSWGQAIFTNPITDTDPSGSNPYTNGQTIATNLSASGIGRGSGITGATASNRYSASGFTTSSTTVDANDYFTFTLTPATGYKINFASFVYTGQRSSTGPSSFVFRSSLDNFTANIGTPVATGATIDLSATAFQGVTSAITFRLYGYNSGAATGTFSVNDFTFNGTVSTVATSTPTHFVITAINPTSPTVNAPFSVTVQAQDNNGVAANVTAATTVNLSRATGTGTLSGNLSGTIAANGNTATITGVIYNVAEAGVSLTATDAGNTLTGTSSTFTVLGVATQLAFVNVPSSGTTNTALSSFTVEARRADNTVDASYNGSVTIAQASGPGTLSGTLTATAVNGVATFNNAMFSTAGTYTLSATATGLTPATSGNITISQGTAPTDYFRSRISGEWNTASTWESSPDGITYYTATSAPTASANTISIQSGTSVTVITSSVTADQVIVRNGAVLEFSPASASPQTFTLNDGPAVDLEIENGGTLSYQGSATARLITFGSGTPTIDVATGGKITTGMGSVVNNIQNSNYIYNDASILEYTATGNFSASGVTDFPTASNTAVPVFRVTNTISGTIGGGAQLTINGVLETLGDMTLGGSSTKILRNGIRGNGSITVSGSSPVVISGVTAELGGTGTLSLAASSPLTINAGTAVSLTANKTISGSAINLNGTITTGSNTLTLGSGASITDGSGTAYVDGSLTRTTASTAAVTFPMGHAGRYTPVIITPNASTSTTFAVTNITGYHATQDYTNVTAPLLSVDASTSYNITRTAGAANADITLPFDALTNSTNTADLVVAHYNGTAWESLGGTVGANSVTVTGVSSFSPFAIGAINGTQPLPVKIASFTIRKQDEQAILNWTLATTEGDEQVSLERSTDGQHYTALSTQQADKALNVKQSYTDATPAKGMNQYRLAITGSNGRTMYSNVLTAVFTQDGKLSIYPNPAAEALRLDWNGTEPATVSLHSVTGKLVYSHTVSGTHEEVPVNNLPNGTYLITWKQGDQVKHQQIQVTH